jgi:hypothetical protein
MISKIEYVERGTVCPSLLYVKAIAGLILPAMHVK